MPQNCGISIFVRFLSNGFTLRLLGFSSDLRGIALGVRIRRGCRGGKEERVQPATADNLHPNQGHADRIRPGQRLELLGRSKKLDRCSCLFGSSNSLWTSVFRLDLFNSIFGLVFPRIQKILWATAHHDAQLKDLGPVMGRRKEHQRPTQRTTLCQSSSHLPPVFVWKNGLVI